jgi:Tol biopolymer transport system component
MINLDGTGLEQITFNSTFDGFPMFSLDGKRLVFGSNRNAKSEGETNVFVAEWRE